MKAHGIDDVMFTFAGTPAWASSNPTDTFCDNGTGGCYLPSDINLDGSGTNQTLVDAITATRHMLMIRHICRRMLT